SRSDRTTARPTSISRASTTGGATRERGSTPKVPLAFRQKEKIDSFRDHGLLRHFRPAANPHDGGLVMRGTTLGLVAACAAMLLAGPAGAQDRPDLLEVPSTSVTVNRPDGVDYVAVQLTDTSLGGGSSANHRQSVRVSHEFPGVDTLAFRLYE